MLRSSIFLLILIFGTLGVGSPQARADAGSPSIHSNVSAPTADGDMESVETAPPMASDVESPVAPPSPVPADAVTIKLAAALNQARLHAGLPLLAVDPRLNAIATAVGRDTAGINDAPRATPDWFSRMCGDGYGRTDCELGGYRSSTPAKPSEIAGVILNEQRPIEFSDRRFVLDAGVTAMGFADTPSSAVEGAAWHIITIVFGRGGWVAGCVVPVRIASEGDTPGEMVFPVLGGASWSDTFGAPRSGHRHQGEDLMAPKMRPLVACFSGTVTLSLRGASGSGNIIYLSGDNGWTAWYLHVNCDTPGTHDGLGGAQYAFAPGLETGDHVIAGQVLGYCGDSGNARGGPTHCHFEIHPGALDWRWGATPSAAVNPAQFLRDANILKQPHAALTPAQEASAEQRLVGDGQIQLDGSMAEVLSGKMSILADLVTLPDGAATTLTPARRKAVLLRIAIPDGVDAHCRISAVGRDEGKGSVLDPSLIVFRL